MLSYFYSGGFILEENEGFVDMIINSIKYGFSDVSALLIGGIMVILSYLVIGVLVLPGYYIKSVKELIGGNNKLPAFDDWGTLVKDSIIALIISVLYIIVIMVVYFIAVIPLIVGGNSNNNILMVIGILLMVFMIIAAVILSFMLYVSWVLYAASGDVVGSINPINVVSLILANPAGFILSLIATAIVAIVLIIPMLLIITIPWLTFANYAADTYIFTWFYKNAVKNMAGKTASGSI
jgi:hypothetical protein